MLHSKGTCLAMNEMECIAMQPEESPDRPKLLVCHDYKGGFMEESWPEVSCTASMTDDADMQSSCPGVVTNSVMMSCSGAVAECVQLTESHTGSASIPSCISAITW